MWNPFKRKHKVPVDECFDSILAAMMRERVPGHYNPSLGLWDWLAVRHGVKREYSWRKETNYLVFDSERDFLLFLIKL
jgi:hypothetical protein